MWWNCGVSQLFQLLLLNSQWQLHFIGNKKLEIIWGQFLKYSLGFQIWMRRCVALNSSIVQSLLLFSDRIKIIFILCFFSLVMLSLFMHIDSRFFFFKLMFFYEWLILKKRWLKMEWHFCFFPVKCIVGNVVSNPSGDGIGQRVTFPLSRGLKTW